MAYAGMMWEAMSMNPLADLPRSELREALHHTADLAADYLEEPAAYPALLRIEAGPVAPPLSGQPPAGASRSTAPSTTTRR